MSCMGKELLQMWREKPFCCGVSLKQSGRHRAKPSEQKKKKQLGIQSFLRRGREVVNWPKMGKDIEDFKLCCLQELSTSHEIPTRP